MAEHHTPRPSQGSQGRLSHPRLCVCSDWRVCLQKTEHGRFQGDAERFLMIVDHPPRTHANVNNPLQRHSTFRSSSSRLPLSVSGTALFPCWQGPEMFHVFLSHRTPISPKSSLCSWGHLGVGSAASQGDPSIIFKKLRLTFHFSFPADIFPDIVGNLKGETIVGERIPPPRSHGPSGITKISR